MQQAGGFRFLNGVVALPEGFHARVASSPLVGARLVGVLPSAPFNDWLGRHAVLPGSDPVVVYFTGHQLGHFAPQLGDGRVIILGEVATRHGRWELQLKGAGLTPFSCDKDRRVVLRSTIREYPRSDVMHGLGIPTSAGVPALRRIARDGRSRDRTARLGRNLVVSLSS